MQASLRRAMASMHFETGGEALSLRRPAAGEEGCIGKGEREPPTHLLPPPSPPPSLFFSIPDKAAEEEGGDADFDATATLMNDPDTMLDESEDDDDEAGGETDATPTRPAPVRTRPAAAHDADADEVADEDLPKKKGSGWQGVPK